MPRNHGAILRCPAVFMIKAMPRCRSVGTRSIICLKMFCFLLACRGRRPDCPPKSAAQCLMQAQMRMYARQADSACR